MNLKDFSATSEQIAAIARAVTGVDPPSKRSLRWVHRALTAARELGWTPPAKITDGDLWWDPDANEIGHGDYYGVADDLDPGFIMQADRGLLLPSVWLANVVLTRGETGEPEDTEIQVFATEAQAQAAVAGELGAGA